MVPAILLALLALLPASLAFYENNPAVARLTAANFDSLVYGTEHTWIIEFYAPWCGHCQRLVPDYEKAATSLKGLVKVGAIDCDEQSNKEVCGRFGIQGFPTLKIFPGSGVTKGKRPGFAKEPKDYQGARSARAIVDACIEEIPNFATKLTNGKSNTRLKNLADFLSANTEVSKAILFTTKPTTTPLFKALSVDFRERLDLGEVRDTEKDIVAKYNIAKFPTLIVLSKENLEEPVVYEGNLQHEALTAFLSKYALPPKVNENSGKQEKKKEQPPKETYNPEVFHVKTQQEFKDECLDRPVGMCLLSFMVVEPEFEESVKEHQAQLEVLKSVKKLVHDKTLGFKVLWIDALQQKALMTKFGLSDQYPSLLIISPSKKVYRPFTSAFEAESIVAFLQETSRGKGRHFKYDFELSLAETVTPPPSE